MNIKEITISASMSKNYQKAEFSITAEITSEQEKEYLRNECVTQASILLDELCAEVASKEEPATMITPIKQQSYQPKQVYNQPVNQQIRRQHSVENNVRPVSQAQINYLKGLGYTGQIPADWAQADFIIKQLKESKGLE